MSDLSSSTAPTPSTSNPATEAHDNVTMPPNLSLTLILAATPSLGIGKAGGLPWPMLKKEMAYFARVTKRTSPSSNATAEGSTRRRINAVIMGRKTWDSIPPKFRPLKDRLNVVVTRSPEEFTAQIHSGAGKDGAATPSAEGPIVCTGVFDALSKLQDPSALPSDTSIDRVFVIGGASIYTTALELPATKRVLLTKIKSEYECDTFFPLNLEESAVWRRCSAAEVSEYTGEGVEGLEVEEQGVGFEFGMWEKRE